MENSDIRAFPDKDQSSNSEIIMSKINQLSAEELRQRWRSDVLFQKFRQAVLLNSPAEDWFHNLPKLQHPWEKDEVGDFRGVFFDHMELVKIDLTSLRFDDADFSGSELNECSLQGAVLSDSSFANAKFTRAHMIPVYGKRVRFNGAVFEQTSMEYSCLTYSSFVSTMLNKVTLSHADLTATSFAAARLNTSDFSTSVLRETDLSGANFSTCDLSRAILQNAKMTNTTFEACDMRGTDFRGAHLDGATIRGGKFGVVQQGDKVTPTRFDDTPETRKLVAGSHAESTDLIEWVPVRIAEETALKRVMAGEPCTRNGFWFTPAQANSRRYFTVGQIMPKIKSDYGATIWQWDTNQELPKI